MATVAAQRFSVRSEKSVFKRLGCGGSQTKMMIARNNKVKQVVDRNATSSNVNSVVCKYWLQGRCLRNPCRFLHPPKSSVSISKSKHNHNNSWKNPDTFIKSQVKILPTKKDSIPVSQSQTSDNTKEQEEDDCTKVQNREIIHNCTNDDKKLNLQSWFGASGLSILARLEGHTNGVSGIVFRYDLGKLFCASKDNSLRVWDCNTGKCQSVLKFHNDCGILVKEEEGSWMFAGLRDQIKAWNFNNQSEFILRGSSGGQVNAITMSQDTLFAGMEDGTILSWKSTSKTSFSQEPTVLKGHTGSVLSLIVGAGMLYSGSSDHSIRVWSLVSLECTKVLIGHTSDVTSLICWDQYLLSGSLDKTIKVWGATENGNIQQIYAHCVDNGVLAFCGIGDEEKKPMLICSCKDSGLHIYDLPSFEEKGRIFSAHDIRAMEIGPEGLFFTGDAAGVVNVWKQNGEPPLSKGC